MNFSTSLLESIRQVQGQYKPLDLTDRGALLRNLVFVYHVIRGSENLLQVAADCTSKQAPLHKYFVHHLEEERQHEHWLSKDLATAGIDVSKTSVPRHAVEMVGSQYYLIYHVDPAALLGYMALLEGSPMPMAVVEELEALHGKALLRTLRYHAEHDIDHGRDLLEVIDALPVDRQVIVQQSTIQAARYFAEALA